MGLEVRRFIWNYMDSNMYIIKSGSRVLIIDPVDCKEAFEYLKGSSEAIVLLTHEHFDHISGLNKLRNWLNCTVIAQSNCSDNIQSCKKNLSAYANTMMGFLDKAFSDKIYPFVCNPANIVFQNYFQMKWDDYMVHLISTPGHSPGSSCIVIDKSLFSGDTLLKNGPISRFPGGNEKVYNDFTVPIIKEILKGIDSVYPGHGNIFFADNGFQ